MSSLVTAHETVNASEIHRTRAFLGLSVALAFMQIVVGQLLGTDPIATGLLVGSCVVAAAVCGVILWMTRRDEDYTERYAMAAAYATLVTGFCAIYFYGVFSPAPIIIPLGIFIFCSGRSFRSSALLYVSCAGFYVVLATLVLTGDLVDRGIVRGQGTTLTQRLVVALLVEVVIFASYVVARNMRATTLKAVERHDIVVRSLAQRDALLREARNELAQAMRVGGAGRFSGEVVGSFRLGSLIGHGGMGEVYEAEKLDTQRPAAVKLVHPQFLSDREIIERFLREAKITSSLQVPNVVRVIEASPADAPIPYLAMERLHGQDLATILREHKRLGMKRLLAMLRDIAAGLDAAHAAGIVHRDLKPRNVFCAQADRRREVWKILDFGVSKLQTGEGTLTKDQIVGTPSYLSPEQALARKVGPPSDVFALGLVVFRALTGSPAFSGESSVEIILRITQSMPLRPGALVNVPEDVELALALALAKRPDDRFASATAFAHAFDAAARGELDAALATRARALLAMLPWSEPGSS